NDRGFSREWLPEGDYWPYLGKTEEAITSGGTGTVGRWRGTLGSETDTTEDYECYNRGGDIATGIWVNFIPRGGGYECFPLECNP
ncbi:MAG TPA: hypothetical protein VLA12_16755, partial [Planctomycetaceae bacterium]|nr:hypothetical protein [Planctomycetaceae bacterium]